MATMLLWLGLGIFHMACLLPQDDDILTPVPPLANRPPRVIGSLAVPAQRKTSVRLAANCQPRSTFSVVVEDPDLKDNLQSTWLIDPDEFGLGGVPSQVRSTGELQRTVTAPSTFTTMLGTLVDGREHRVEVVVTDGLFDEMRDGTRTYLVVVPPINAGADGGVQLAYRDEWVWVVEVLPCP